MMKKTKYILIFAAGLMYSCQVEFSVNEDISQVVVDGVFSPQEAPVIVLNQLGDIDGVNQVPVTDANVAVYSDDKLYHFTLGDGDQGAYIYNGNDLEIAAGNKYQLEINYMGNVLFAEATIPYPVKDIELKIFTDSEDSLGYGVLKYIGVSWNSLDNSYFYTTLECDSLSSDDCNCFCSPNLPFFECNLYIGTEELVSGNYYKLIIYSMTEEYAEYYYGSPDYGYTGNIENGYGIFTGINLKSISFQYLTDSVSVVNK